MFFPWWVLGEKKKFEKGGRREGGWPVIRWEPFFFSPSGSEEEHARSSPAPYH